MKKFLALSFESFTPDQIASALALPERVAGPKESRHPNAEQLVEEIAACMTPGQGDPSSW